jgi:hypothetical protein
VVLTVPRIDRVFSHQLVFRIEMEDGVFGQAVEQFVGSLV